MSLLEAMAERLRTSPQLPGADVLVVDSHVERTKPGHRVKKQSLDGRLALRLRVLGGRRSRERAASEAKRTQTTSASRLRAFPNQDARPL